MSYRDAVAVALPPWMLPVALLPAYLPEGQASSEWVGYVGIVGAVLAMVGLVAGPRRITWLLGAIAFVALVLALGQFEPLYPVLYRVVPGLALFRVPARWLIVYSFVVSMLVGLGVQALANGVGWRWVGALAAAIAAPFGLYALVVMEHPLRWPSGAAI